MVDAWQLLLVEDNRIDELLLRAALAEAKSLKIDCCTRLADAKLALTERHYDAVLLDLGLPDSSGLATLRDLKSGAPDVPVVVLTGLADEAMALSAMQDGAQDYIAKGSIEGHQLLRVLRYSIERQHASEILFRSEMRASMLLQTVEQSPLAMAVLTLDGRVEYINPSARNLTGQDPALALGQSLLAWLSVSAEQPRLQELEQALQQGLSWVGELYCPHQDGRTVWLHFKASPISVDSQRCSHMVVMLEDTSARRAVEETLLHQANFDQLTGLPNRLLALDRLQQAVNQAGREDSLGALLFIDLDGFKIVNDSLGHALGDELLLEVARRLQLSSRDGETVARFGGDEFIVIGRGLQRPADSEAIAKRLMAALEGPFRVGEHELHVSSSVGITLFPSDGVSPTTLLQNADAAMYRAKSAGRNCYQFFTPALNEAALQRLVIEGQLRQALDRNEIFMVYQPLVRVADGVCIGVEALMRWNNAELGAVRPDVFIPVAEDSGLIGPLGDWALSEACCCFARLQAAHPSLEHLAVNVSVRQLRGKAIVNSLRRALAASGLPAQALDLELTERLLVEDSGDVLAILNELVELGVRLSIDDFGTGYSALGYLQRYPFGVLKVDRSFVMNLPAERPQVDDIRRPPPEGVKKARGGPSLSCEGKHADLTIAILAMASASGLMTVGEGVETEAQLAFLSQHGCTLVQGYLLGRPMDEAGLLDWLAQRAG